MESQLNDMCYKIYILKILSEHISDAITIHAILLVLPDSYSTFCTILNSSPATIGSFSLSTNTVITQVLIKEKNIKLGSSQISLIAYTKERKITTTQVFR